MVEEYFESSTAFYLTGTTFTYAVQPVESTPEYFPYGSDVLAVGCSGLSQEISKKHTLCLHCNALGFEPLVVVVYGEDGVGIENILWHEDSQKLRDCSSP